MNEQEQALFNALCDLQIYHYCDCLRPEKVGQEKFDASVALLVERGIIEDQDDAGTVWERYDAMVEEFALDVMPSGFASRHDYWGAKIISDDTGWNAPKEGLFTGDDSGHFMYFEDYAALVEYASDQLTPA
jgi:hypothetical protein